MNLSALNHHRFDKLYQITQSHMKATLLDKCIFYWQNSTYTLDDNQKWFTRSISALAKAAKISERSVSRYLKEFAEKGLIEKKSVLKMKKHLYVRVTNTLLSLLKLNQTNKIVEKAKLSPQNMKSINFDQAGVIKKDFNALSIYKDNIVNTVNSTVSRQIIIGNHSNLCYKERNIINKRPSGALFDPIDDGDITERLKNYVKGVLKNLQIQYNLKFSNPNKLFAEVLFSLVNTGNQFPGIEDPYHRMNIIAKLLREKRWTTPKGFYNHSDIGRLFKEQQDSKEINCHKSKQANGSFEPILISPTVNQSKSSSESFTKLIKNNNCITQIKEITNEIQSQKNYLKQIQCWSNESKSTKNKPLIDSILSSIQKLHEKRIIVEEKLTN